MDAVLVQDRECGAESRGGNVSRLDDHAARILALVAEKPELSLEETVAELKKQRIQTSRSSL
jgi:hypothetical protein